MDPSPALVSPPQQGRSRRAWARILDVGEQILEAEGLEGFTIAAICERAQVSAAAIYARVPGKDALFLAVYEQTLTQMALEREQLDVLAGRDDLSDDAVIRETIQIIAGLFLRRAGFVRSVVWLSNTDAEVARRGSQWMTELGREFVEVIARPAEESDLPEAPRIAESVAWRLDVCYRMVWSAIVMYISHGPGYASTRTVTDEVFTEELVYAAQRMLDGFRDELPA